MTGRDASTAAFFEQFSEFCRNAARLEIDIDEQLKILNIDAAQRRALSVGDVQALRPDIRRRLSYALPFMRRLTRDIQGVQPATIRERVLA